MESSVESQRVLYSYRREDQDGEPDPQPIPGSYNGRVPQIVELVTKGHHFFQKRMESLGSSVFKCSFFGAPFVAITDYEGIQCLFDPRLSEKETGFGNFRFNQNLLGDHVPSMFENGERHKQLKSFLIAVSQNMLRMGRLIPNIMDIVPEHLIKWNFKEGMGNPSQEEWEERILHLAMDVLSESMLGIRLSGHSFIQWRFEVLKEEKTCFGKPTGKYKKALHAFNHLKDAIANSPDIEPVLKEATKHGLTEEEAVLEILWMLNFNGAPGTGAAMRSVAARLSIMTCEERTEIKNEIRDCLGPIGLNLKTLHKMKKLDNLVCEVLRMYPPVALYFGIARRNFFLKSSSGIYKIDKGQRMVGSCHLAQRDRKVFGVPGSKSVNEFDPSRFNAKGLKSKLICTHGPLSDPPSPDNHKCTGTNVGYVTIKCFALYLIMFCDWSLEEKPFWTDKSLVRYGNPDEPIRLKYFKYTRDKEELLLPDQPDSSSSDEDMNDGPAGGDECPVEEPDEEGGCPI
ncbi:hypothetical protein OS493_005742 [Desmophyllum pertusum]|uniref:Cytochrome P450 n=1 Tax=Desmophyllum pertusum TaxID=174260 RepID=A0A9W9YIC3_9CNID|nr:hypothetical protein OS493_005742 [Desmophyllum pertusum]